MPDEPGGGPPIGLRAQARDLQRYLVGGGLGPFLIRVTAGSGAVQAVGMLLTFVVGVQLARGLGVEGYGQYGIAMAVIALLSIPGEFGLPKLVTREVAAASAKNDLPRLFGVLRWADRMSLRVALPIAALVGMVSWLVADHEASRVAAAIAVGAVIIPLIALARIRGAALQGLRFVVLGQTAFELVRPLIFSMLLFALFMARPEASAADAMVLNVLTAAAALVLCYLWLRARLPAGPPVQTVQQGRRWLASALPMAMTDGLRILQPQIGMLLLGVLSTSADAGLFRVAVTTAAMTAVPLTLGNTILAPVIAGLHAEGDRRRLQKLSTRAAQAMTAGVLTLGLVLVFGGPWLVGLVFGPEFAPAYPVLVLVCAGQFISGLFGANAILLNMTGHERRVTRAMIVALVVNIALALALVPLWGAVGAAAGFVGSLVAWNVVTWLDARKFLGIETSVLTASRR